MHMKLQKLAMCFALGILLTSGALAQTRKALANDDVVNMTKQGFDASLIVTAIQTSDTNFDVSAQALVDLKNAGVSQTVMEAMLTAAANKPSAGADAAQGTTPGVAGAVGPDASNGPCNVSKGCLIREGTQIPLKFLADISSKTAAVGDPVEFVLDDDVKAGDTIVIPKGAHALATVSNVKKAGMLGKAGELNVQLNYLIAGDNRLRLRGTQGHEGESKTGATVALVVLFGPIGLIKHGKNIDIPAGTPLVAYADQDIWLPPAVTSASAAN
jgi:hypothetical protein